MTDGGPIVYGDLVVPRGVPGRDPWLVVDRHGDALSVIVRHGARVELAGQSAGWFYAGEIALNVHVRAVARVGHRLPS